MLPIVMCFEVHQPIRLSKFGNGNGSIENYFDHGLNKFIFERIAKRCYWPTNKILMEHIDNFKNKFRIAYSITGPWLEQCEKYDPSLLDTFKQMAQSGSVEFLDETHYHSLSSLFDANRTEFIDQVKLHHQAMHDYFGVSPNVFRNTEVIYNNAIAKTIESLGYKGIITEGIEKILQWRSPNYLYKPPQNSGNIKIMLRNYRLSDDIGYRFSAKWWEEWPLTANKYAAWLSTTQGQYVNLFVDYETFGEHQWSESGIFEFLRHMPNEILKYNNLCFSTPSEIIDKHEPVGLFDVFEYNTISWADMERDISAWLGNEMQHTCYDELKALEPYVKQANDPELLHAWRLMQTSDHLYYMCTKWWNDGDVHKYFSSFGSPAQAFSNMMKILYDFKLRLNEKLGGTLPIQTNFKK